MVKNCKHDRLKTILEAGNFRTMNEAVPKYLQCSTEMTGNANSKLYTQRGNNYLGNNFRNSQITKKILSDKFPLPRIDDILDQLGRAKYFSFPYLMSGFRQIELEETSRNITSFSTSNSSYRFTRLPYGFKIA